MSFSRTEMMVWKLFISRVSSRVPRHLRKSDNLNNKVYRNCWIFSSESKKPWISAKTKPKIRKLLGFEPPWKTFNYPFFWKSRQPPWQDVTQKDVSHLCNFFWKSHHKFFVKKAQSIELKTTFFLISSIVLNN